MSCCGKSNRFSWWPPVRIGEVSAAPSGQPMGVRPAPIPIMGDDTLGVAPATEFDWFQLSAGAVIGVLGTMIFRRLL